MTLDFTNTTCVVTGAADGVGLGLARAFGRQGARIALLDIRLDAASTAASDLTNEGIDATPFQCDISDHQSVISAAAEVMHLTGQVNLAWCNAGVGSGGNLADIKQRTLDWIYAVNVTGTLNTYRAFAPLVRAADGLRHIGFTASSNTLGHIPDAGLGAYAASK